MKLALGAAALTGVQVGSALVASQAIGAEPGPGRPAFWRYAIALLLPAPLAALTRSERIRRTDPQPVALIGWLEAPVRPPHPAAARFRALRRTCLARAAGGRRAAPTSRGLRTYACRIGTKGVPTW